MKIINIEDSNMTVDLIDTYIKKVLDLQPKSFTKTQDVIEYCKKNPDAVDLIITNLKMPGLEGIELLQELDTILTKPAYAILHSGYCKKDSEEVKHFFNLNLKNIKPADFFEKPFNMKSFIKKVGEILNNL